jgi:diguanylate cyclase (GGDEF)-like protein/PAS domain S-box-containing protein
MRISRVAASLSALGLAGYWILKHFSLTSSSLFSCRFFLILILSISLVNLVIHCYSFLAESRADRLARSETELKVLRAVINSLPDRIYVKDKQSRFILANRAVREFSAGSPDSDILGRDDFSFFPEEVASRFFNNEQELMRTGMPVSHSGWDENASGRGTWTLTTKVPYRDEHGNIVGLIGIGRDITEQKHLEDSLVEAREEMRYKATHDALTSLLNRGVIMDLLSRELNRTRRENGCTLVLLADIDYFKLVNDVHGHVVGDEVLREVARRLLGSVRSYDFVGRYGGEEFLLILNNCDSSYALDRAEEIRESICSYPIHTSAGVFPVTTSIGVLASREWGSMEVEEILREVDGALYSAKAGGRNCCRLSLPMLEAQNRGETSNSQPSSSYSSGESCSRNLLNFSAAAVLCWGLLTRLC